MVNQSAFCLFMFFSRAVIGVNVEDEDRETTWTDDADSVSNKQHHILPSILQISWNECKCRASLNLEQVVIGSRVLKTKTEFRNVLPWSANFHT